MSNRSTQVPPKEWFEKEAQSHLVAGDLFTFKNPVIPIKTRGRWYGALSQRVVDQGMKLPDLGKNAWEFVDPYIFVALWGDEGDYTPEDIFDCAAITMHIASTQLRLPKLALPVLGGKEGMQWLWAAERGIFEESDYLDAAGFPIPDHVYVTDKLLT